MGLDDANDSADDPTACIEHMWVMTLQAVAPTGTQLPDGTQNVGLAMVDTCQWCGALKYEASNFDRFPDTDGLDPAVYSESELEQARKRVQRRRDER